MKEALFYILIRSWNAFEYFDRCVDSVLEQNYKNYKILFIDDHSNYNAGKRMYIKNKLRGHCVKFNNKRLYSLRNAYSLLSDCPNSENAVVFNLDGDDWLLDNKSLETVAKTYHENENCLLTYGECLIWDGSKLSNKPAGHILPYVNRTYSPTIIKNRLYREVPFFPLHPRTWKLWLFNKINKSDFLKPDGSWINFAEDQAIYYPMLEMANGNFKVITNPIYVYNLANSNSDINSNLVGLLKDELLVRKKPKYEPIL